MPELALYLIKDCIEQKDSSLDLSYCGLTDEDLLPNRPIHTMLKQMDHLTTLILSNRKIQSTAAIRYKSKAGTQRNILRALPSWIGDIPHLSALICFGDERGVEIGDISGTSSNTLKHLYLDCNMIWKINGLENLPLLETLTLGYNRIKGLHGLSDPLHLKYLNLDSNFLEEIDGIEKLIHLETLSLENNRLTKIPDLRSLTNLSELILRSNRIESIKSDVLPKNLLALDLSKNNLTTSNYLGHLVNLEKLDLSYNLIKNIKELSKLPKLRELDLHSNAITEIVPLFQLKQLSQLFLGKNQIENITRWEYMRLIKMEALPNLENIKKIRSHLASHYGRNSERPSREELRNRELDRNLETIEDRILENDHLTLEELNTFKKTALRYKIQGNPLTSPPIEIINQGQNAVLNYFSELEKQGKEYLYEAKLLIVGQPRAGKTTLRYKLLDNTRSLPSEDMTTRGIDIDRLSFDILDKDDNIQKFHYNVWDFGGQQIYQTTHQFFLTHRSLYILVIDTGKDSIGNDDSTINYWLQAVELLGGNSPLFLFKNEKNERIINIDLSQKKARFSFLKRDFNIDLSALAPSTPAYNPQKVSDFEQFREDLQTELKRLPLVGFPMPKNWVKIRQDIQKLAQTKPYISIQEYLKLCKQYEVEDYERQMELSRIFHDLGVFLHFQEYSALEDFIVLQNTWATDAVFAVLDCPLIRSSKGRFQLSHLQSLWESKGYFRDVHSKLLELMMKFELCYQLDKGKNKTYIVPELLPDSKPDEYNWQPANDLPLQYRYDFMPKGLLTRLVVRLHEHIYVQQSGQSVWKTGVKVDGRSLDCPNTFAEITEAWDNKQLSIRTQGPFAKDLISKLTYEIDTLNSQFFRQLSNNEQPKSKWYKMIPCNCETCTEVTDKHFYDYSTLLKAKEKGKDIQCQKSFDAISVQDLLDGVFVKEKETFAHEHRPASNLPKKIFISYSKEDLPLVNKFIKHLSVLQQDNQVAHWYCTELVAGSDWDKTIKEQFDDSDIVCFMISANFMNTEYIHEHEIKRAFERKANDPNFQIVPIILNFCQWQTRDNNLGQYTALPYATKPVADFRNPDTAWYLIAECLTLMIAQNLSPTGNNFYQRHPSNKKVLDILERIISSDRVL